VINKVEKAEIEALQTGCSGIVFELIA